MKLYEVYNIPRNLMSQINHKHLEQIAKRREANLASRAKTPKISKAQKAKNSEINRKRYEDEDNHKLEFNDILKYKGKYFWRPINGPQTNHRDGTYTFSLVSLSDAEVKNHRLVGMWSKIHSDSFSKDDVITKDHPSYKKLIAPVESFTRLSEGNKAQKGIPANATDAELRKARKAGGDKGKRAHWLLNMRKGNRKRK